MGFERPMMLLGALTALIPVTIHLIDRARAKDVPFAALEFLFLSDKRLARRLRLRQLLVLALRVLLLIALSLAFAKPFLTPDAVETGLMDQPGAVVLVIDDSASMAATVGGESLISRALARARDIVAAGGERTRFAVVTASAPARRVTSGLTFDRQELERALGDLAARPRVADLRGALLEAERLLSSGAGSEHGAERPGRVVVIGDSAAAAWRDVVRPWSLKAIPEARVIDVRVGQHIANVAVMGVGVRLAPELGDGAVELAVQVKNFGASPTQVKITLEVAGRTLAATQSLAPGAASTKHFVEKLSLEQAAGARGVVRIEGDALTLDDRFFFTLEAGGAASVAVINGAPRPTVWLDELFYVRAALLPDEGWLPRVRATVMSAADITKTRLDAYGAVFLANVGALSAAQRLTLENYVSKGGALLVSAGDQFTQRAATTYGKLLPSAIRGIKAVVRRDDPSAPLKALSISQVDSEHPAMAEFSAIDDASLFKTKVYAYALVDNTRRDARVVVALSGGVPALLEAALGRGKTMLLTTTIDRDWTDLPIRTSFVPFLQQTLLYLADRLGTEPRQAMVIGDIVPVVTPAGDGRVTLTRPDGATRDLGEELVEEVLVAGTDVVGHYVLSRKGGKEPTVFAINADRAESDLTPADPAALRELLSTPGSGEVPQAEDGRGSAAAVSAPPPNRTKVWPFILMLLFVLLASEAWLVLRS